MVDFRQPNSLNKHGDGMSGNSGMINSILLIQCPPWDMTMPPLGIAYLSSYLNKRGYKVSVFDLNIHLYHLAADDLKYLWDQKSYNYWVEDALFSELWFKLEKTANSCISELLKRENVKYIGLSVNFAGIKFTSELIKIIKDIKKEVKIILGGWGCVDAHMRSLFPQDLVDVFVIGEGEETLIEVIEVLEGNRKQDEVLGVIFTKRNSNIYKPRPPIINLDNIHWPTFDKFDLSQYSARILPLLASRGCISTCSFCNDWRMSKPYRSRSAANIFEEIKYHIENSQISNFSFKDLLCNGSIERLDSLADLIISSGLKLNWDSQAILRKEMTPELLLKLKRSGCETLIYGVESFSNNVLKKMKKLFTKDIAEEVLKNTYEAGINTRINIIVGFPGETERDFEETLEAIERNRKYISGISAISVCLVNNDCDLDIHYQDYGLILPEDLRVRAKEWTTSDGKNNYTIRRQRAEKIINLVNQLGFSYVTSTL